MTTKAPEPIETDQTRVACNGSIAGKVGAGHPNVYLEMDETGRVQCPYCSRVFVLNKTGGNH
jgi:NADH dehydrogenase (ubiquinone) Fe-S protein 6